MLRATQSKVFQNPRIGIGESGRDFYIYFCMILLFSSYGRNSKTFCWLEAQWK